MSVVEVVQGEREEIRLLEEEFNQYDDTLRDCACCRGRWSLIHSRNQTNCTYSK